jgi:hypothetical protein
VKGHRRVEHDQVDAAGDQQFQGPVAVGGQHALVTGAHQGGLGRQERIRLVVDDEDAGHYPPTTATPSPSTIRPTS